MPTSPPAIVLSFDEHITLPADAVQLHAAAGASIALGSTRLSRGGTTATADVHSRLADGAYTVDWHVLSDDGDDVGGSYQFAVGSGTTAPLSAGSTGSTSTGSWQSAAARWLLLIALAILLGDALARRITRSQVISGAQLRIAAAAGVLAGVALVRLAAGDGSLLSPLGGRAWHVLASKPGAIAITEASAFTVALLIAIRWPRRAWIPTLAVIGAEAFRAHPADYSPVLGELLTGVHLAAATAWLGTLLVAVRHVLAQRRAGKPAWLGVAHYARLAVWLVAAVLVSGTVSALVVLPLSQLDTRYGLTLLIKLVLVAGALIVALTGRRRLARKLRTGIGEPPAGPMRIEATLLVATLAVTAVLTTTRPPQQVTASLTAAPAPIGPVLYLGDRAGQLGITVAASGGQLVVHLFPPGVDAPDEIAATHPQLSATLTTPGQGPHTLDVHSCGGGCFLAVAPWRSGTNELTLRAAATGWTGGELTLAVPWPPKPDPAALTRLVDTLRNTPRLIEEERVTSDTSRGLGAAQAIRLSGARFLATEPYSNGRAASVNLVRRRDGTSTIYLGYPDQNIYARLELGADGRPVRETVTDPDHLITRIFRYP